MPRQNAAGVLDPRAPLISGFQQIAHLPRHVPHRRHSQQMPHRHSHIPCKNKRHHQRTDKTRERPLPRFLGTQMRRQRMLPDRPPDEIRRRISHPDNHHRKQQQQWPLRPRRVQPNRVGKRKRHQHKTAGANSCGWQCFYERAPGKEGKRGDTQHEQEERPFEPGSGIGKPPDSAISD